MKISIFFWAEEEQPNTLPGSTAVKIGNISQWKNLPSAVRMLYPY